MMKDVFIRAIHKTKYHIDYVGLSVMIIGLIILQFGDLIGWTLSSRGILAAMLATGGCYCCTWKREFDKLCFFFSGFFSAILLFLVTTKLKGLW